MIVITGASDGLGKALAKQYKDAGVTVVNVSRTSSEYADHNLLHDLRNDSEIQAAAKEIGAIDETLEAVVHCAGVMSNQPMGQVTGDEIERLLATNVKSQILLTSELLDRIKRDKADIVNVSSTVGAKGRLGEPVYASSKWAVRGFAKSLQEDFKQLPNRVISFCPGGFDSGIFEKAAGYKNENFGPMMDPNYVALCLKQILDLPKNMEVSEIFINRKAA